MAGINLDPTLQLVLTTFGIVGAIATVYVGFRTQVTKATIGNYRELVDSYSKRIEDLEQKTQDYQQLHIENVKAIGELQGQLSILKDIPLQDIALNQREIAKTLEVLTHHWGIAPQAKSMDNPARRESDHKETIFALEDIPFQAEIRANIVANELKSADKKRAKIKTKGE